eukprot:190364-Chlamydomonas_euryale.AAC.1
MGGECAACSAAACLCTHSRRGGACRALQRHAWVGEGAEEGGKGGREGGAPCCPTTRSTRKKAQARLKKLHASTAQGREGSEVVQTLDGLEDNGML